MSRLEEAKMPSLKDKIFGAGVEEKVVKKGEIVGTPINKKKKNKKK